MSGKILIVEDEPDLAELYLMRLTSFGYDVSIAMDGEVAYESIKRFNPDVVVLDLLLPKINGLKILSDIKSDPERRHIKVIVVSNLGNQEDIHRGISLGADSYIVKSSINMKDLIDNIKKHLGDNERS